MTTALAIISGLGALVSWWHSRKASQAAAQVEAGKKAVASVSADLDTIEERLRKAP